MHGRVKSKEGPSEAEIALLKEKATKYGKLLSAVLGRREDCASPETSLLVTQLLRVNPDIGTAWNIHREGLLMLQSAGFTQNAPGLATDEGSGLGASVLLENELTLTADCIRKNPKSYGAWHHREWVITHLANLTDQTLLTQERELCANLLKMDARNFHCWSYLRFIASLMGEDQAQIEFAFSTHKIHENFSNYSAYHHRSIYIRLISSPFIPLLEAEFAMTENAVYTEPDDQSTWWYRMFLYHWIEENISDSSVSSSPTHHSFAIGHVGSAKARTSGPTHHELQEWYSKVIHQQLTVLRELLAMEQGSKWTMTELVTLLSKVGTPEAMHERRDLLGRLAQVDPVHKNRYAYLVRKSPEQGAKDQR